MSDIDPMLAVDNPAEHLGDGTDPNPVPTWHDDPPPPVSVTITPEVVKALRTVVARRPNAWAPRRVTVTTTAGEVFGRDPRRHGFSIVNRGDVSVFLAPAVESCQVGYGVELAPNDEHASTHTGAVFAITETGTAELHVITTFDNPALDVSE